MKQLTTRLLYEYWNDVRGARMAPTRFEIEPGRMTPILAETFILEHLDDGSFPFRLAGSKVCERFGRELRGSDFLSLVGSDHRVISEALESVTSAGAALVLEIEVETADNRTARMEGLLLGLVHPVNEVTRYLGTLSVVAPEPWLGIEPVVRSWLISHELVWPEDQYGERLERQLPFSPELAAARIVRTAQRQFRVLDGGRKE